MTKIQTHKMTM